MEKNGLSNYKVLSEEAEPDKSDSAFDKAKRDKGMEESERVYHILMEKSRNSNLTQASHNQIQRKRR